MRDAPRRLVLLRHGRTAWNLEGRFQGQADVALDDLGREQAGLVAPAVAALVPTRLWSSDLARARETADQAAKETGLVAREDARLREIDVGRREGFTHTEFAVREPAAHALWQAGERGYAAIGGESAEDVAERMRDVLAEADADLPAGECAVLVSHGAAIRIGLAALLGWPLERLLDLAPLANCGWVELTDDGLGGGWRLAAYNRVAG